jgi:beta-phosphoglucomutase
MLRLDDFSAVIFDMDGLVLDTETTYVMAWRLAAKTMGYELSKAFCLSLSGLPHNELELKLKALWGSDFSLLEFHPLAGKIWRHYARRHGIKIKPGFNELLAFIVQNNLPYCLATNSPAVNTAECLAVAGLQNAFSTIITRDDVEQGKPAPDIFLTAAERLQVNIRQCLVLEDSRAGIAAAAEAGAFSIYIPSTDPVDPLAFKRCNRMMKDLGCVLEALRA